MTEQGAPRLPGDRGHLSKLLDKWASSSEDRVTAARLRRIVGMTVVAQMLDGLRDEDGRERFGFKGGSALELRFGHRARDSKDVDGAYRGDVEECRQLVADAVSRGWSEFTGAVSDGELITNPGLVSILRAFFVVRVPRIFAPHAPRKCARKYGTLTFGR